MRQRGHGGRLRALTGLMVAAIIGLGACAGPPDPAGPSAVGTSVASGGSVASTPAAGSAGGSGSPSVTLTSTDAPTSADAPLTLPDSLPVSMSVPAIDVTSPLSSLGRNPDGTVQVPSLDDPNAGAGWFRDSPEPGALGPAIILGHVDSRQYGPGVFYDLKNLGAGDTIEITRADGTVAVFTVDSVQDVPKAQFPTQQVYGNLDHAGLRLITCGGVFDSDARSYEDNIIAFASLTSSRPA